LVLDFIRHLIFNFDIVRYGTKLAAGMRVISQRMDRHVLSLVLSSGLTLVGI